MPLLRLLAVALLTLPLALPLAGGCTLVRAPIVEGMDAGTDASFDAGMRDVPDGADAGPDTPIDTGIPDTGGFDVPERIDTGTDTGMLDTGVDSGIPDTGVDSGMRDTGVDAGMPDTGVDAGMPDTGVDAGMPDVPAPRTCNELFGAVNGYIECTPMAAGECEFYADLGGTSNCADACAVGGSTCLATYNNSGAMCGRNGVRSCTVDAFDRICVCQRIP